MEAMSGEKVLEWIAAMRPELERQFSVSSIGVFGSIARGEETSESDVDVLVELEEPTFRHYMDLKFLLEDTFGRPVDLVMADAVKPRLKPVIAREVIYA